MSETNDTPPEVQKQIEKEMAATGADQGGNIPPAVNLIRNKMDRRQFIGNAIRVAAALIVPTILSGDAPSPQRPGREVNPQLPQPAVDKYIAPAVEVEPKRITSPLIVDIPPTAEHIQEAKDNELIKQETNAFDLPVFFNRVTGANYEQLEKEYYEYKEREQKLLPFSEYLLQKRLEKEALCLMLSNAWSSHGVEVAQAMRNYRDSQKNIQTIQEQNPDHPNDPNAVMTRQITQEHFVTEPYRFKTLSVVLKKAIRRMNLEILIIMLLLITEDLLML